jgi:hypothetical protein
MRCYCAICRKTDGGGGYAINIMGDAATLRVEGEDALAVWQAPLAETEEGGTGPSPARRRFCRICGSALCLDVPRWAENVYPFASEIDTPLPRPPERLHIMLDYAMPWVEPPSGKSDPHFARFPEESILDWHKRHGLYQE